MNGEYEAENTGPFLHGEYLWRIVKYGWFTIDQRCTIWAPTAEEALRRFHKGVKEK